MNKTLFLDIEKVPLSEEGIVDFYWPIRADEMYELYLQLLSRLIFYIRDAEKKNIRGVDSAIILYRFFIGQVMSLYEAWLFLSRSDQDGVVWSGTQKNPWITAIKRKQSPEASSIIRRLRQGPAPLSKMRAPLRFARDLLISKKQGMRRYSLTPCNYKEDIVSLSLNPLAIQKAHTIPDRIYYQRDQLWFHSSAHLSRSSNAYSPLVDGFLECVTDVLEEQPEQLFSYFREWLTIGLHLSENYLNQLQRKKYIPKRLWVGTASHLWGKILGRHVKKNAGHITRFDHGCGGGYFANSYEQGAHDYEDCDTYVSFSANQAREMKAAYRGNEVIQTKCPDFIVENKTLPYRSILNSKSAPEVKKIMYVASIYPNGHFYPAAKYYMRNHVLLDWEMRLMRQIKAWGYELMFKPHPTESICLSPPESIEKILGPVQINEVFEKVYHLADLIILDDPATSLFKTLLTSGKPFVYIDFGVADFSKEALLLLEKRCRIVKGQFDLKNRAVVDWAALKEAILSTPDYCNNREFLNFYF